MNQASSAATSEQIERWRRNYRDELDGIALYQGLAQLEKDPQRARTFRELAEAEESHAQVWRVKLVGAGVELGAEAPSSRIRLLLRLARWFGAKAVLPSIIRAEAADASKYHADTDLESAQIAAEENAHRDVLAAMRKPQSAGATGAAPETWHRTTRTGSIRAAVFGMNDGLVSNLALVLGVAAAGADSRALLITGLAGLLAGSFSMAVGEYVSVASQRDLLHRQVALEAQEMEENPEGETAEMTAILERKGIGSEQARAMAVEMMKNPTTALETMVREELGLDPSDLGSPVGAAASSFVTFTIGAAIPLSPFLLLTGMQAAAVSAGLCALVLAGVGALLAMLSGTSVVRGVVRMVGLATLAAGVTIGVGRLVGANLG
jgi:VIT1/CCC1 family predicted Fe2+/Mn2+ transporter